MTTAQGSARRGLGRAPRRGVAVGRGLPLGVVTTVGAGEDEAVGPPAATLFGGPAGAGGATWATSSPATPRMAGTMTKASGQISLFMILARWLCQGWLRPQATESCTQSNSARAA